MATSKDAPAKKGASTDNVAPPSHEASDWAGNKEYKDNPDKPAPDSVAQVEVLPEDN